MTNDTITSADLPALRHDLAEYQGDDGFSRQFRRACAAAIAAIDSARDDDPATHHPLEIALRAWVAAAEAENARWARIDQIAGEIESAEEAEDVFSLAARLFEILSPEMRARGELILEAAMLAGAADFGADVSFVPGPLGVQ